MKIPRKQRCNYNAFRGWWCSRRRNHRGPCALRPRWWFIPGKLQEFRNFRAIFTTRKLASTKRVRTREEYETTAARMHTSEEIAEMREVLLKKEAESWSGTEATPGHPMNILEGHEKRATDCSVVRSGKCCRYCGTHVTPHRGCILR